MVYVKHLSSDLAMIPVNKCEVLRYMGAKASTDELDRLVCECIAETAGAISAKLCFAEYALSINGNSVDLEFCKVESNDLAKNLSGCNRAVVFAATVGIGLDRLIAKYSRLSPARALCVGAIGNERVEALCDLFCKELKDKYKKTHPRYSAGYGDLDLSVQRDVFKALGCTQNIGISLSDSLLMTPTKSVTAIVGIESGD